MEIINYANGSNMTLPEDAQIVQGVSGNAVYLPAGAGTMPIAGNRNELTISLWRQWDGVVEADHYRGVFSTANIKAYFDQATDFLTIELAGTKTVTDIKDDQVQTHWCFLFSKNGFFKIYKNAELKAELTTGNYTVDFSKGFTLGGGRTHATFDEVLVYVEILKQEFINGLYHLVSKGTVLGHVEHLIEQSVPLHTPRYLGTVKTPPEGGRVNIALGPKNGFNDASIGDWILIIEPLAQYQKGWCYRWTGSVWQKLDPPANYTAEYSACLKDQLEKCKDLFGDTNFFGSVFCQFLGFNKAVGQSLAANTALLDNLTVKRLLVDNDTNDPLDFELAINREVGILAKNNGKTVFEVTPLGNVYAKNATMIDGYFSGELNTPTLKLLKKTPETIPFSFTSGQTARDMFNSIGKRNNSSATGSFKGRQIVKISSGEKIKIITDWRSWNRYAGIWEYLKCEEDYYYVHIITDNGVFEYGTFKYGDKDKRPQGYLNPDYAGGAPEYCGSLSINKLDENISFYFTGNFETFMLSNLPTTLPNEVGIVWVDTQGYLRLKL